MGTPTDEIGPCSWLIEIRNPAFNDPEWYPDSPSDVYRIIECGAPVHVVKVTAYGEHTRCENGHTHDPYGSPESLATLWEEEMRERAEGY